MGEGKQGKQQVMPSSNMVEFQPHNLSDNSEDEPKYQDEAPGEKVKEEELFDMGSLDYDELLESQKSKESGFNQKESWSPFIRSALNKM